MHLAELDGADDKFFFAGSEESALASLLNLNLQLFGGMYRARNLGLGDAEGLDDRTGDAVEKIDGPPKGLQEPRKGPRNHQGNAFGARQADGLRHEFADDHV